MVSGHGENKESPSGHRSDRWRDDEQEVALREPRSVREMMCRLMDHQQTTTSMMWIRENGESMPEHHSVFWLGDVCQTWTRTVIVAEQAV